MADEERDVTEKPEDADVDASEEEEGVTDQDGDRADPEPEEPDWKRKYDDLHALHLASKDKIEAANSWKSELDTLKESIQESLASGRTKDVDPTAEKLAKIRKFAEDGDVVAQDNLELREAIGEIVGGIVLLNELNEIDDKEERKQVRALLYISSKK